jgi:hypothetical protein
MLERNNSCRASIDVDDRRLHVVCRGWSSHLVVVWLKLEKGRDRMLK